MEYKLRSEMNKKSPLAVFLAASTVLATSSLINQDLMRAGEMGGLKEWTTDQDVDEESKLNKEAEAAAKKAKEEDICIPIGEGENCW